MVSTSLESLFVDDLALIGRNLTSIQYLIRICNHQFQLNGLQININKSKILTKDEALKEAQNRFSRTLTQFETQEVYRYLGVVMNLKKGSSLAFLNQRKNIVSRFKSFKGQLLILAKESFDFIAVGADLFTSLALASTLYGIEVISVTKNICQQLDSIQAEFAAKLLKVNTTCAHAGLLKEMGWAPVSMIIAKRKLKYWNRLQNLPQESWASKAFHDCLSANSPSEGAWHSKYRDELQKIHDKWGIPFNTGNNESWKTVEKALEESFHKNIAAKLKEHREHSLKYLPEYPISKYRQGYINGSKEASVLTKFRLGHANLGNRDDPKILICPSCGKGPNNELHLAFECEAMSELRQETEMKAIYDEARDQLRYTNNDPRKLKSFLGNDFASDKTLLRRGNFLSKLRQKHLENLEAALTDD